MNGEYPTRRDFLVCSHYTTTDFVNSLMLPSPVLEGLVLRRVAAFMGLALNEMPGAYALLKVSDTSLYVISLILLSDKRFSKLTLFMKIHLSISNLLHANPTFSKSGSLWLTSTPT